MGERKPYQPLGGGDDETAVEPELVEAAVLWRRLDAPGHDAARLVRTAEGWRIEGMAVFAEGGSPACLRYRVDCGEGWRTRRATVEGWVGARRVEVEIAAAADRRWTLDGRHVPIADGCLDLDLAFTPATNLLPIRRLALAAGAEAAAPAAWLTFPELALERLEQTYRRSGEATYDYAAHGGSFRRALTVTSAGFVSLYPGLWELA